MDRNKSLLKTNEVATLLNVSASTVRRWADSGILECYRIGNSKYRKFELKFVQKLAEEYFGEVFVAEPEKTKENIINSNISADSHPAHYLMHKYWGRKPHNVINEYLKHFTKPGDTVLEPFMGSGVTVIESLKLNRKVIGIDINPMAYFIVKNSISQVDLELFKKCYKNIYDFVYKKYSHLYKTKCPICGRDSQIETALWENDSIKRIKGVCIEHVTFLKDADITDVLNYENCCNLKKELLANSKISYPTEDIMKYVQRSGRKRIDELFSDRALIILSSIRDEIYKIINPEIRDLILFCFTSMLSNVSRMLPGDLEKSTYKSGWVISKFWTPKIHTERNIFMCFELRFKAILKGKKQLSEINPNLASLIVGDSTKLDSIADNSIDYIFTDPPYGESIAYLALSQFWNSWVFENIDYLNEIIIDPYRQKDYKDYQERISNAFKELFRVLKPESYLSFTFHSRDINVWKAILDSCLNAGFMLESIIMQEQAVSSGTQGINQKNTLTGDFIYNFKKSNISINKKQENIVYPENFIKDKITELILKNNGVTPSQLYENLIPIIVRYHAYSDNNNNAINIEKILKENFDYIEIITGNKSKIGEGYQWIIRT